MISCPCAHVADRSLNCCLTGFWAYEPFLYRRRTGSKGLRTRVRRVCATTCVLRTRKAIDPRLTVASPFSIVARSCARFMAASWHVYLSALRVCSTFCLRLLHRWRVRIRLQRIAEALLVQKTVNGIAVWGREVYKGVFFVENSKGKRWFSDTFDCLLVRGVSLTTVLLYQRFWHGLHCETS